MDSMMFIKSIIVDNESRIVVSVQDQFLKYLEDDITKKMLRETAVKALGEDFVQLEISKKTFRLTVVKGSEERSKTIVEEEIVKSIEMALSFMNQFGN